MEKKFFGFLLLLVILFACGTNKIEVDGAFCAKPSKFFQGYCGSTDACFSACSRENWPIGACVRKGFLNEACECRRPC